MISVLLIYPYFKPLFDRSVFRFPPLGIGYIAASLQEAGYSVYLLDCTFLHKKEALEKALTTKADVIGIYCMSTMLADCIWFAQHLRSHCQLLVAGGPLPSCTPVPFLDYFDVVVRGEGEQTMKELLRAFSEGSDLDSIAGIVYRQRGRLLREDNIEKPHFNIDRGFIKELDDIPFPARVLFPNDQYLRHGKKKYGYSITTIMSTRGCPFRCEFCSNVLYRGSYRERSLHNLVDEIEEILNMGYDRISFADDVFTLNKERVNKICEEIRLRKLQFSWECLGRVDELDYATAVEMKKAGCVRIFFGIESGNDHTLKMMNKMITVEQARKAVEISHQAGLEVGAFFILFYPGETEDTVLETLRFAASLPLDYLGLTLPYPLPDTDLYERVKDRLTHPRLLDSIKSLDSLPIFDADFSRSKMQFGILKGQIQFRLKKRLGKRIPLVLNIFERSTDVLFRLLR